MLNGNGEVVNRFSRGLGHLIHSYHHGFYLFNVRTDVVQRVDSSGNVIHTYRYDAFGNQLNGDETNTNPFRFAGEYYDWETGFIYLRARFYNPAIGRFISEDPYWTIHNMQSSVAAIIQSSNLFVYCGNNPIKYIDPSGLFYVMHDENKGTFWIAQRQNQWDIALMPFTIAGRGRWCTRTGSTVIEWDFPHMENLMTVATEGLPMLADTLTKSKFGTAAGIVMQIQGVSQQSAHTSTILMLMYLNEMNNLFSSASCVVLRLIVIDSIINRYPNYFFSGGTTQQTGQEMGHFFGSRFLNDMRLYNMTEERRSEALRNQVNLRGTAPMISRSNWTDADFQRENAVLMNRIQSHRGQL